MAFYAAKEITGAAPPPRTAAPPTATYSAPPPRPTTTPYPTTAAPAAYASEMSRLEVVPLAAKSARESKRLSTESYSRAPKKSRKLDLGTAPAPTPIFTADDVVEEEMIMERKDQPEQNIKASTLTAGEVNDFSKWQLWQDIAANDLHKWQQHWEFSPTERYTIQLVTQDGQPLVDADVQLRDKDEQIVWLAKTDNTGKAELWANLFVTEDFTDENNTNNKQANASTSPPKVQKRDLSVSTIFDGQMQKVASASKFHDGVNVLKVEADCNIPQFVDIAMVVDATGSMGDEINYLKVELSDVIERVKLENDNLTVNLGSVFYRDHTDDYLVRKSDFSTDISKTVDFIQKQNAAGGGDFPEAVDAALSTAINDLEWSDQAVARILFLVLDAPPHHTSEVIQQLATLSQDAANKGIRIIPIAASGIDKATEYLMRSLALATNGTYVFLTDDSGVGGKHIKPTTDNYKVETLNDLMVRLIQQYTKTPECSKRKRRKNARKAKKKLNEELKNIVRFYPNPTKGNLNIESKNSTIEELFIADANGKIIERLTNFSGKTTIDLSAYPSGYYLIRYPNDKDSNRWLTEKIMLIR